MATWRYLPDDLQSAIRSGGEVLNPSDNRLEVSAIALSAFGTPLDCWIVFEMYK